MGVLFHFYDSEDDYDGEEEDTVDQLRSFGGLRGVHARKQSISERRRSSQADGRKMSYAGSRKRSFRSHRQTAPSSSPSKGAIMRAQEKVRELKSLKTEFKEGFWNVNSVMLGGLGKDPVLEEDDAEAKRKSLTPVEVKEPPKSLKQKAAQAIETRQLIERESKVSLVEACKLIENDSEMTPRASIGKTETPLHRSPVTPPSAQERLEQVWTALQMTDSMKLDMAIKYSCNAYYDRLEDAMARWEVATDLILDRERLLENLEKFERHASDPNRFFEKGSKRSSVVRLEEAKRRSNYYRKIDTLDVEIKNELDYVMQTFHDEIKYKGRPYAEKMKWDRVEMLYWLQEERKQQAIQYETMSRHLPLKHAMLEPIQLQAK